MKLFGLYNQFYDVDPEDTGRVSLWDSERLVQLGNGELKRHAGYLTSYDGSLWCGRSDGAGNAQIHKGPVLYRINADGTLTHFPIPPRSDWTPADKTTGLVFLPGHVCWLVSKAVGAVWYGGQVSPEGLVDRWNEGKGYHTERREVWLLPYTWPGLEERPPIVLREFHESAKCGGLAYDAKRRRLYVHQAWAPPDEDPIPWETPVVRIYEVGIGEQEPAEPVREMIEIRLEIGAKTYAGSLEEQ